MPLLRKSVSATTTGNTDYISMGQRETQKLSLSHSKGVVTTETYPVMMNSTPVNLRLMGDIDCSRNPPFPEAEKGDTYRVTGGGMFGTILAPTGTMVVCVADTSPESREPTIAFNWTMWTTSMGNASFGGQCCTGTGSSVSDYTVTDIPDLDNPSNKVLLTEKAIAETIVNYIQQGNLSAITDILTKDFNIHSRISDSIIVVRITLVIFNRVDSNFKMTLKNTTSGESVTWEKPPVNTTYTYDFGYKCGELEMTIENCENTNARIITEFLGKKQGDGSDPSSCKCGPIETEVLDEIMGVE